MNKLLIIIIAITLCGCNSSVKNKAALDSLNNLNSYFENKVSPEDSVLLKGYNSDSSRAILIKGKVKNSTKDSWLLKNDGFLGHQSIEIEIQSDGLFRQIHLIEGLANLYLMLNNDAININAQPKDIIELYWDENDFNNTIKIKSPTEITHNNLQLNLNLYKGFRSSENTLRQIINQNTYTKEKTYEEINDLFNSELTEIINYQGTFSRDIFAYKIYFKFLNYLLDAKLIDNYSLELNKITSKDKTLQPLLSTISLTKFLSNDLFYKCPEYRDFLYNYIISNKLFDDVLITNSVESRNSKGEFIEIPYTQTKFCDFENDVSCSSGLWTGYYNALSQIGISSIRDWYITYLLINSFKNLPLNEVEAVYNDFLSRCYTKVYKDTLTSTFNYYKHVNSGIKAPEFTLKNENGKSVSLSEFKGKVVYLDFWGISCAPCLNDIKTDIPALHLRYKSQAAVFINICVDSNEGKWKNSLNELKMEGINLLAEGFTTNQVCKDYNIDAIPHYLVIDKNGYLKAANAPRPAELLSTKMNIIDKLLLE